MAVPAHHMEEALGLIRQKRYIEARDRLVNVHDDPAAERWLAWLDEITPSSSNPVSLSKQPTKADAVTRIRGEIEVAKERLLRYEADIQSISTRSLGNKLMLAIGILTSPLLGVGIPLVMLAQRRDRQREEQLAKLRDERQDVLDRMEKLYINLAALRATN